MMDIWSDDVSVQFGAIDKSDRLTLSACLDYFQEAAIHHAEHLGVGREAMARTSQVWILSRMSVVFSRRPRWREPLRVSSWPRGAEKLFAVRDYDIRDAQDRAIVRGRSGWIILDMEKHRPLRPVPVMENLPFNEGRNALEGIPRGLPSREDLVKVGERCARYSDIDYNGHVNNVRYIQWIQDMADPELLERADTYRLDINYVNEIKLGDLVELWTCPIDVAVDTEGAVDRRDDAPVFEKALALEGRVAGQAAFRAELRTGHLKEV